MEQEQKIQELARSLKELHLAATMEEALARAREMVLSAESTDKPLREVVESEEKENEKQE